MRGTNGNSQSKQGARLLAHLVWTFVPRAVLHATVVESTLLPCASVATLSNVKLVRQPLDNMPVFYGRTPTSHRDRAYRVARHLPILP